MTALIGSLRSLGLARLVAMGGVAVGMLALFAFLVTRSGDSRMALLYADLDPREASQMADVLERQRIAHVLAVGSGQINVPAEDVTRARVALAKEGLPSGGSLGYELFDRGDALTSTQFQQSINQTRALEGELARTIRGIAGVRAARVHLVLSHREPFARDKQDAQASVLLTTTAPGRLDREGVQAIVNLVAAAVPGLRPANIAVVDSRGTLLARAGQPTGPASADSEPEGLRRAIETRLARAVEQMLERGLGPGHVRAEAAVTMDFDQVHETQERFDPEGQVVRSTQAVSETSRTTEATQSVSVQNNLPNADAGTTPTGSQDQRQDETTNYEIGRTVRTLVREQPQIARISLAVLVDEAADPAQAGTAAQSHPRSAEELDRIGRLVRSAIGFDEKRGDKVEIVSMRFAEPDADTSSGSSGLLGLPFDKADALRLGQTGLLALVAVLALLLVLRPMVIRLTSGTTASETETSAPGAPQLAGVEGARMLQQIEAPGAPVERLALPAPDMAAGKKVRGMGNAEDSASGEDRLVDVGNVEGQMRASSIRRVAELVDKHPDASLTIVRAWMQQEPA